jgi:hypothetical protein
MRIKDILFNICIKGWYFSEKILDSIFLSWLFSSFVIFLIVLGADEDIWTKIIGSMFFGIGGIFILVFVLPIVSMICEKMAEILIDSDDKKKKMDFYFNSLYPSKENSEISRINSIEVAKIKKTNNDFEELKKVANFIAKYRKDIVDMDKKIDLYYVSLESVHMEVTNSILKIVEIINTNLKEAFYNEYSSADEMILKVEPILDEILNETNKLKGILSNLDDDEIKIYYKMIIKKFLSELEMFFVKLEILLLNGGSGEIKLIVNLEDEIKALKNALEKQNLNKLDLSGFILGLGLGYLIGSD